jgi:hypothetical protein
VLIIRRINFINTTSGMSHVSVTVSCAGRKGTFRLVCQVGHLLRIIPSSISKLRNLGKKYSKNNSAGI